MDQNVVQLTCGHTSYFTPPPNIGDTLYCRRCTEWYPVLVAESEYWLHCRQCGMAKQFGTDVRTARRFAVRHIRKCGPHHVVLLKKGNRVVETIEHRDRPLPGYLEWHRNNPEHQSSLRSLSDRYPPNPS